jgi:hypothetical protein
MARRLKDVVIEKLVKWFGFRVVLPLTPLVLGAFILWTNGQSVSFERLIGRGELLLLTTVIAAGGIGELAAGSGGRWPVIRIILAAGNVIFVFLSAAYFSYLSAALIAGVPVKIDVITHLSRNLYLYAVVTAGCSLWLSEAEGPLRSIIKPVDK